MLYIVEIVSSDFFFQIKIYGDAEFSLGYILYFIKIRFRNRLLFPHIFRILCGMIVSSPIRIQSKSKMEPENVA